MGHQNAKNQLFFKEIRIPEVFELKVFLELYVYTNMWSRRSAIERCPSPWNRIRSCPTVTDNGLVVKGTDIFLKTNPML